MRLGRRAKAKITCFSALLVSAAVLVWLGTSQAAAALTGAASPPRAGAAAPALPPAPGRPPSSPATPTPTPRLASTPASSVMATSTPTPAPTPTPASTGAPIPTPAPTPTPTSTGAPAPTPPPTSLSTPYYGLSLSELQVAPPGVATVQVAEAEVQAIHDAWDANTVRLQIAQDELTGADGTCPLTVAGCLPYYSEVQSVTNYALGLGLTVVINDTTEAAPGFTASEPMPTYATEMFWRDIAAAYSGNPHVIFDLFNEPRGLDGTGAAQWQVWRDGGQVDGASYLGMQTILSYVRNTLGAPNMVWADGLDAGGTLNGIAPHAASGTLDGAPGSVGAFALSQAGDAVTGPLVYTFHHPMGSQTPVAWWRDFGYLPALGFPVMNGEWNNAVDGQDFCWSDAPTSVPAYLSYLASDHIGLTGWELGPNVNSAVGLVGAAVTWSQSTRFDYSDPVLADSPASYETPTSTSGNPALTWNCAGSNDAGSGWFLRDWFATQGG